MTTTQSVSPSVQSPSDLPNRWLIAAMGTLLQLCLGTVYAWSTWTNKFKDAYGWDTKNATWAFSFAILFLGLAAAWGGIKLPKFGPRKLAMIGGVLFGVGYLVAAAALYYKSLLLMCIGYGVIGGIGLGLGYVTPVATVAKWFPDHKGLATGMVIMGFGFGSLLMSKLMGPQLIALTGSMTAGKLVPNYPMVFAIIGVIFLVLAPLFGSFLKNPPAGFMPKGYTPATGNKAPSLADLNHDSARCVTSGRFGMMWLVFFCNICAGIALISLQSPLMQDLLSRGDKSLSKVALDNAGNWMIAIGSVFNGLGRFFWGSISDRIGRAWAFRAMLLTEIVAFTGLMFTGNPWVFGGLICYIFLCYGGGFGTMPSFVMDVFGAKKMALVYGVILTAWSAGGVAGPQLFAWIKDRYPLAEASRYSFEVAAGILALGLVCTLMLSNKAFRCRQIAFNKCKTADLCVALEKA